MYMLKTLKNKYVGLAASFVLLIGVITGGLLLRQHAQQQSREISTDMSQSTGNDSVALNQPQSVDSVPLNRTQSAPASSSGGLSVSQDITTRDLGQNQGISGASQGQTQSSSAKQSTKSSILDPKTFGQYEKYKPEQNALFGEVQEGTGAELTANKKAAVYYRGWLTNGQVFDESRPDEKGQMQPFVFTMGAHQVIPGWEQALAGMKVGGTRLLIVPPATGYGSQAQGSIPANSVLIFQVELAAVQ